MIIPGLTLPELPGYRMEISPIRNVLHEWWNPDGSLAHSTAKGEADMQAWRKNRVPGKRMVSWFQPPEGSRVVLNDQTLTGPGRNDYLENDGPRPVILCDYGGAYVWTDGACDTLAGASGCPLDRSDLEARFDHWQGEWEALDLLRKDRSRAKPPQGWRAWALEGLDLCAELAAHCGPGGVVIYRHAAQKDLPELRAGRDGLALHWVPLPGEEAVLTRALITPRNLP